MRGGRTSNDPIMHQGLFGDFEVIESSVTLVDEVQGAQIFWMSRPSRARFPLGDDSDAVDFLEVEAVGTSFSSSRIPGPSIPWKSESSGSHSLSLTLSRASTWRVEAIRRDANVVSSC